MKYYSQIQIAQWAFGQGNGLFQLGEHAAIGSICLTGIIAGGIGHGGITTGFVSQGGIMVECFGHGVITACCSSHVGIMAGSVGHGVTVI